jgi:alpha-glucosidase (family GH31 glycosyl hydrolase)
MVIFYTSRFMSDFGEYTPVTNDTALAHMHSDALYFHNRYPFLWARFQRGIVEALGLKDEALVFHRSASMESGRYMNLFWAGDQNVNWQVNDGIKSVVTIMAHMGLSGYPHQHSDVGGYTTILTYAGFNVTRSPELLGRWGELAAVSSSVFRSHEGNIPQVNTQFYSNTSTYDYYAYNARMFVALAPYRRKILETECATKGWPLLRPPVMYHTNDLDARRISYQSFYLGPSLYVSPVLDPDTTELEIYLPGSDQQFIHVWSGICYDGGQRVSVAAPHGKPAVFLVKGQWMPELQSFLDFVMKENNTELSIA